MALHEKHLQFDTVFVNLAKDTQYEPWFLKINPRGEVPVLQDTGKVISDSTRIIDYLEDNFSNGGTPRLIPINKGVEVRQKVIHFRSLIDPLPARILTMGSFRHDDFVRGARPPFIGPVRSMLSNADKNVVKVLRELAEKYPEYSEVLLNKVAIHEQKSCMIIEKGEYQKVLQQFDDVLTTIENELASHTEGKENWWLCCEEFTIADIGLAILLERLNQLGYASHFWRNNKKPHIERYYTKVQERESFKKTIPNLAFHTQMFISTYKKQLAISIGVGLCVVILVGGAYLIFKRDN